MNLLLILSLLFSQALIFAPVESPVTGLKRTVTTTNFTIPVKEVAVVAVDYQNDFGKKDSGALGLIDLAEFDAFRDKANSFFQKMKEADVGLFGCLDTHPDDHCSFYQTFYNVSNVDGKIHLTPKSFDLLPDWIKIKPNGTRRDGLHSGLTEEQFQAWRACENLTAKNYFQQLGLKEHDYAPFITTVHLPWQSKDDNQALWNKHCVKDTDGQKSFLAEDLSNDFVEKGLDNAADSYSAFFNAAGVAVAALDDKLFNYFGFDVVCDKEEPAFISGYYPEHERNKSRRGERSLIVCGLASNVCARLTALDAKKLGYNVFFVEDLSVAFGGEIAHQEALNEMRKAGVTIVCSADIEVEDSQLKITSSWTCDEKADQSGFDFGTIGKGLIAGAVGLGGLGYWQKSRISKFIREYRKGKKNLRNDDGDEDLPSAKRQK